MWCRCPTIIPNQIYWAWAKLVKMLWKWFTAVIARCFHQVLTPGGWIWQIFHFENVELDGSCALVQVLWIPTFFCFVFWALSFLYSNFLFGKLLASLPSCQTTTTTKTVKKMPKKKTATTAIASNNGESQWYLNLLSRSTPYCTLLYTHTQTQPRTSGQSLLPVKRNSQVSFYYICPASFQLTGFVLLYMPSFISTHRFHSTICMASFMSTALFI
jgi:hypothetical protein